jgi:hypothetical protein
MQFMRLESPHFGTAIVQCLRLTKGSFLIPKPKGLGGRRKDERDGSFSDQRSQLYLYSVMSIFVYQSVADILVDRCGSLRSPSLLHTQMPVIKEIAAMLGDHQYEGMGRNDCKRRCLYRTLITSSSTAPAVPRLTKRPGALRMCLSPRQRKFADELRPRISGTRVGIN